MAKFFQVGTENHTIRVTFSQYCGFVAHFVGETLITLKVTRKIFMFVYFYDLVLTISALMMTCLSQVEIYLHYCHGELMA